MKKIISVLAVILAVLLLGACGATAPAEDPTPEFQVPTGISYTMPDGFAEQEAEGYQQWYSPDYPTDTSNINLIVNEATSVEDFGSQSDATYIASVKQAYKDSYDIDADVVVDNFESYTMDGYSALRIDSHTVLNDISFRQVTISINADKLYNITFTDSTTDSAWMNAFNDTFLGLEFTY